MSLQRLSSIEAAVVALEHRGTSIRVGAVGLFDAGPLVDARGELRLAEVRARIEARLHLLPRLRQRVAEVWLGQDLAAVRATARDHGATIDELTDLAPPS